MTQEQANEVRNIINRNGRMPDQFYKNGILDVIFVRYNNLHIGIERDGYAHT